MSINVGKVPSGKRAALWLIMAWAARLGLLAYLVLGISTLKLTEARDYVTIGLYGFILLAYAWVEIASRKQGWRHQATYRAFAIAVLGLTTMNVAAISYAFKDSEAGFFKLAMEDKLYVHMLPFDIEASRMPDEGPSRGRLWTLSADQVDDRLTLIAEFKDAESCQSLLGDITVPSLRLVSTQFGDQVFDGWPRKDVRKEHCAEKVVFNYKL